MFPLDQKSHQYGGASVTLEAGKKMRSIWHRSYKGTEGVCAIFDVVRYNNIIAGHVTTEKTHTFASRRHRYDSYNSVHRDIAHCCLLVQLFLPLNLHFSYTWEKRPTHCMPHSYGATSTLPLEDYARQRR